MCHQDKILQCVNFCTKHSKLDSNKLQVCESIREDEKKYCAIISIKYLVTTLVQ